jgi:hypothetical protein
MMPASSSNRYAEVAYHLVSMGRSATISRLPDSTNRIARGRLKKTEPATCRADRQPKQQNLPARDVALLSSVCWAGPCLLRCYVSRIATISRYHTAKSMMLAAHGDAYCADMRETPAFLPHIFDVKNLLVQLSVLRKRSLDAFEWGPTIRIFLDSCFFLSAIPLSFILQRMQEKGLVPIVVFLP